MARSIRARALAVRNAARIAQSFHEAKLDYAATKPSKFRRIRRHLGGSSDAHVRTARDMWEMREYARDFDRNDTFVGQMVDRAVDNIVGTGLALDPQTGDESLNEELRARWESWANDKDAVDIAGRFDFATMERLALRHMFVDGDVFILPLKKTGQLQMLEADRCASHHNLSDAIVHGIELSGVGRPLAYLFKEETIAERKRHRFSTPSKEELKSIPAKGRDGFPRVLHVYNPKRITQTRGITVFAPIFDRIGMLEDLDFAELVKAQVVSCIAAFIVRNGDHPLGPRETELGTDNRTDNTYEELAPGLIPRLREGEDIRGVANAGPKAEYLPFAKHIIRSVSLALGLPLEIALLDTTESNFHGYRGALQQARIGFRCIQRFFPNQFHKPAYLFKLREWLPDLGAAAAANPNLTRCRFQAPGWPYVDPSTDAKADQIVLETGVDSPRGVVARRGRDWDDVVRETVEDRKKAVLMAITASEEIEAETGEKVHWRELLNWAMPKGFETLSSTPEEEDASEDGEDGEDGSGATPGERIAAAARLMMRRA